MIIFMMRNKYTASWMAREKFELVLVQFLSYKYSRITFEFFVLSHVRGLAGFLVVLVCPANTILATAPVIHQWEGGGRGAGAGGAGRGATIHLQCIHPRHQQQHTNILTMH